MDDSFQTANDFFSINDGLFFGDALLYPETAPGEEWMTALEGGDGAHDPMGGSHEFGNEVANHGNILIPQLNPFYQESTGLLEPFPLDSSDFPGPTGDSALSSGINLPLMNFAWIGMPIQSPVDSVWDPLISPVTQTSDVSFTSGAPLLTPFSAYRESNEDISNDNSKKRRKRLPSEVKSLLDETFEKHKANPYIPLDEIKDLALRTKLSIQQVRTYFANARARRLSPAKRSESVRITRSSKMPPESIMERFLSSSPEDEGISELAIRETAKSLSASPTKFELRRSSTGDTVSTTDDAASSASGSSRASFDSASCRGPRRGRKRQREPTGKHAESLFRAPPDKIKIYQCTFCPSDFGQKYDWKRHEESVHFPQKEWICMPDGPTYDDSTGTIRCTLDDESNPSNYHLQSHHYTTCMQIPLHQRTFSRKDKLLQHLAQVHRHKNLPKRTADDWCRPIQRNVIFLCGLCALVLPDWQSRCDHIATHFVEGVGMNKWLIAPGGMIPSIDFFAENYKPVSDVEAQFACAKCPLRFHKQAHIVIHSRQFHKEYLDTDRATLNSPFRSASPNTLSSNLPITTPRTSLTTPNTNPAIKTLQDRQRTAMLRSEKNTSPPPHPTHALQRFKLLGLGRNRAGGERSITMLPVTGAPKVMGPKKSVSGSWTPNPHTQWN